MSTDLIEDLDVDLNLLVNMNEAVPCQASFFTHEECSRPAEYKMGIRHARGSVCPEIFTLTLCAYHVGVVQLSLVMRLRGTGRKCVDCRAPLREVRDVIMFLERL